MRFGLPLVLTAALLIFATCASCQSFVQATANAASTSATSFSVSFPSNTVSGDLILVGFDLDTGVTPSSVTDSQGNVFTQVGSQLTSPASIASQVYYAKNIKGGADTVTVNLSLTSSLIEVYLAEYSGVDQVNPIDVQAGATGTSAAASSGNATTKFAGDIIYGFCEGDGSCTVGSGFTARSTFNANLIEDMTAGNPGTYAATGSASDGWAMHMVALKAASTSPSFTLSATPASTTLTAGTSAAYTVTVTPSGGFTGTVSLTASGLPTNATASFSPSTIATSGTSTMTVTTASSTTAASYALTITGTSGSLSRTATATLVVSSSTSGGTSGGYGACDVNKDGSVNVVDVQVSADNGVACPTTPFATFYSQVVSGVFSSCPVTTGLHTVALSWTASTTSGVTYNVYRATASGGYNYSAPLAAAISGTSFTDCNVVLGQTYYYVVIAVSGSTQSAASSETSVTIPST